MEVSDLPQLVRNAGRFNEVVRIAIKYGIAPWLGNVQAEWCSDNCAAVMVRKLVICPSPFECAWRHRVGYDLHQTWPDSQHTG